MPVSSVAITIEGVIQKNVSSAPIPLGIALYHSLAQNFNVLLLTEMPKKEADHWLSLEALTRHAAIEYNEGAIEYLDAGSRRRSQLNSLRTRGYHIDLVIEPSPSVSALLIANGFSTMTFTHAQYALPQWRPDYDSHPRPWDELEKEATRQAHLRHIDKRLKELDEASYD